MTLRLGTRRSPMAIAQSRQVAGMITERTGRQVEIVGVTTLGDVSRALLTQICLLYTSPSPRDGLLSRMPSSA